MKCILSILFLILLGNAGFSQPGQKFVVNFDFNSSTLSASALTRLDSLANVIRSDKTICNKIELNGHTDSIGSAAYNEKLSKERIQAVKDYLERKGVADTLIKKTDASGKHFPLNDNGDSIKRFQNRRVEIVLFFTEPKHESIVKLQAPTTENVKTLSLDKVEVNSSVVLENLNFYPGNHQLVPAAYPALELLLNTMKENPTLKIQIEGHVCCTNPQDPDGFDSDTYTYDLSRNRARMVYVYLIEHDIDASRLSYVGFGGKHPLVKEYTETDKAKNRRVEIKIVSK